MIGSIIGLCFPTVRARRDFRRMGRSFAFHKNNNAPEHPLGGVCGLERERTQFALTMSLATALLAGDE